MKELHIHDALIHLMVTMSAADRSMTDSELKEIGNIVNTLPVFDGFDTERLIECTRMCSLLLQEDDGLEIIFRNAKEIIPPRLYDTAYALAVEVAAADLHLEQEELRLLQLLRDALGLDRLRCAAIEAGAAARHRKV